MARITASVYTSHVPAIGAALDLGKTQEAYWEPVFKGYEFAKQWAKEQKLAVLARDLNRCIAAGGNIYFLAKIGATDGKSFQQMAGSMTGLTEDEYRDMMINGGRSIEGNRRVGEGGDAQAHRQPQGKAGRPAKG